MAINKGNFTGILRLGKDAVVRQTNTGHTLTEFQGFMAGRKDRDGNKLDYWTKVTYWGNNTAQYHGKLPKGTRIMVAGTIEALDVWTPDGGEPRPSLVITGQGWPENLDYNSGNTPVDDNDDFDVPADDEIPF